MHHVEVILHTCIKGEETVLEKGKKYFSVHMRGTRFIIFWHMLFNKKRGFFFDQASTSSLFCNSAILRARSPPPAASEAASKAAVAPAAAAASAEDAEATVSTVAEADARWDLKYS